ncbi:uncharacterized protein LOC143191961 [Rhynchophorus ferrugineus]|uniref:Uncharacterized protein n=1 Tax=Rhynchophorus ferrugineus TaxID=354439 RepID=A0A834IW75_RHYFE|nr:hypothetical protein GWI33_000158 [Rhynchophorus ferrugineus]
MRIKNFVTTLCVILIVSFFFVILGQNKHQTIQDIVTTTNEQFQSFKENLRDAEKKALVTDQKLLDILGFTDDSPRLYPKDVWKNSSLPIIVTYVLKGEESQAIGLINNVAKVLANNTILVYNLGLSEYSLKTLQNYCNSSKCQVMSLNFYDFPSHVQDEVLHAYRPLIIQDALSRTGAILFLECNYRFMFNVTPSMITDLFERRVLKKGVLTFPLETKHPVTSLTHKKMFEYFRTDAENFQFLQMVKADVLFFVNLKEIHQEIILPWIQCALTHDCIFPIGAQSVGCKFDKKPSYRYSGCHSYDVSALNIVLGLRFKFMNKDYTFTRPVSYFTQISLSKADALLKEMEQNTTTEGQLSITS